MKFNALKVITFLICLVISSTSAAQLIKIAGDSTFADEVVTDFTTFDSGLFGAASQAQLNNTGLDNISLVSGSSFIPSSGFNSIELDFGHDGNLISVVNGDMHIVQFGDPVDYMLDGAGFRINLIGTAKVFGFLLVDEFNALFTINTYAQGLLLDSISYQREDTTQEKANTDPVLFESDTAIDAFEVVYSEQFAGWGLDNIFLADRSVPQSPGASIPEPYMPALLLIGLLSLGLARHRD